LASREVSTEGEMNVAKTRTIGLDGDFAVLTNDASCNREMNLWFSANHYSRVSSDSATILVQSHSDLNWHCLCVLHLEASWRASHLRRQVAVAAPFAC
jgi:hypothetical protein